MKIAIVEDDPREQQALSGAIGQFCADAQAEYELRVFADGESFIAAFTPGAYDIIFLDIIMGGVNGMEVAQYVRTQDKRCKLVFITSSDAHAVASYEVQATHYMLKPFEPAKLHALLANCFKEQLRENRFIEVMSNRHMVRLMLRDILYADIYNNAVQLHTTGGLAKVYSTFRKFAPSLMQDKRFLQCYQGCIVNMDHVTKIVDNSFLMSNGDVLPIRIKGNANIKELYANYMFRKMRRNQGE